MYRVGIIGAGRIGCEFEDCHASAYKSNPDTELMVIIDKNFDKALFAASKWDVPITGDEYWQMGELGIGIVSICTPPQTHCQVLKDMLLANWQLKAIYCEKPIAIKLEEAREMIALCRERKVILQVNHQRRFGTPTFLYSRGIFNTGTHMVDMLRMYFGDPLEVRKDELVFERVTVKLIDVGTEKHIFEFKIPTDNLIKKGVEHLVDCLNKGHDTVSSGEEALKDLEILWKIKQFS